MISVRELPGGARQLDSASKYLPERPAGILVGQDGYARYSEWRYLTP